MLIDWFTVIAQVINFLILVFLLKRFLYKPIMDAIDKRKKLITDQLTEAADLKREAEEKLNAYEEKEKVWEETKDRILKDVQDEANEHKQKLLEEARSEYSELRRKLKESLEKDKNLMGMKLKVKTGQQVIAIARKVLKDLGDANLEDQFLKLLISKIDSLSDAEIEGLVSKLGAEEKMIIASEFELNQEQQNAISTSINKVFKRNMPLEFMVRKSEGLIGIEITVKGYKISWAVGNYLDKIEKEVLAIANEFDEDITHDSN